MSHLSSGRAGCKARLTAVQNGCSKKCWQQAEAVLAILADAVGDVAI